MEKRVFQNTTIAKTLGAAANAVRSFFLGICFIYLLCLMGFPAEEIAEEWDAELIKALSATATILSAGMIGATYIANEIIHLSDALPFWFGSVIGTVLSIFIILFNAESISILGNCEATHFMVHFGIIYVLLKCGQMIVTDLPQKISSETS